MDTIRVPEADGTRDSTSGLPPDPDEEAGRPWPADGPSLNHLLTLIEEQGQVGFWWHDVSTEEITVSPGLARITGVPTTVRRTRESMLQAIHPRDRRFQDDVAGLIDLGQPLRREFRIVRPDGTVRWVSCKIDVVLGDDGRPVRFIGILVDITERREALRAVEYNRDRRIALMKAMSAHFWVADARGESADVSAFCRMTGLSAEECKGDGWTKAVHTEDRERVIAGFRAAIRQGDLYEVEHRLRLTNGTYCRVLARAAPVKDPSGNVLEWQGVTLPLDAVPRAADEGGEAEPPLSGAQIRGARGLLDWSLAQLASRSGVSVSTIKRMEDGSESSTRPSKSGAVRRALESGGVAIKTVDGITWISL